jgi:hypothetical protein
MIKLKSILLVAACVGALGLTTGQVQAQGRGNFDPAAMKQRIVDGFKDSMAITNDDEWKVIGAAIGKVVDAQFEARAGAMRAFGGRRQRNNDNGGDNAGQQRPNPFGQAAPEADDLKKAIDEKASADVIKAKLASLREANAAKEAKLTAAQEDLKKLLTSRQEAVAVLYGILK